MYRHAHSMETYRLRVHQFTVQKVGKEGNNLIAIHQVITHHTKVKAKNVQTCQFKVTYRLKVHQFEVQQVGKGNNSIVTDQVITQHKS